MKFKVNNEEVFASTGGRPFDKNKPLIIFVHGSGLTHMTWVLQTRYFAFHGYSVLALDLPGHGLSGGKSLKSIEEMADWVSSVIDAVGYKEASLVGHSQGCLVTIECTSRYPNKIKTLSLMGGAGAIPMNPELLSLAENNDPKAVDLMMDWAHGPAGHFGGHPVPGLYHINTGGMLAKSRTIKDTLGVDFRACDNYKNGLETAPLRMKQHCSNAEKAVDFLKKHKNVARVIYPTLHEGEIAARSKKYLKGGNGALVGIELKGGVEAGKKFIESLKMFYHVANIGDARSLAIHPATTTHSQLTEEELLAAGVTPGYVRLSIGIEHPDDIVADLDQALNESGKPNLKAVG